MKPTHRMVSWPEYTLSPPEIKEVGRTADAILVQVTQRIESLVLAGLLPLVTMPGHDEPRRAQ